MWHVCRWPLIILTLLLVFPARAGDRSSVSVNLTAKVLRALNLSKAADLNFGNGYVGDGPKIIAPGDANAAVFNVSGEVNQTFSINFSASSVTLTRNGGTPGEIADEVVVDSFQHNGGSAPVLDGAGSANFSVGARRSALVDKAPGEYTGTLEVAVVY